MVARTLQVRCTTWEQVEVFTTRKLRKGKLLSMKVPFSAKVGSPLTIGLELPNSLVIAIDGVVHKVAPVDAQGKPDPNRTWIEIELTGFNDEVKARLRAARADEPPTDPQAQPFTPPRRAASQVSEDLPADERELFKHLTGELRRLRQVAVHEVLGVPADAGPEVVRMAWKDLIRRHHPDLVSRRNAPAITHLAEELTILANRAYDRMRGALAGEGRGALAGPSIASPPGWLVAFEDMLSGEGTPPPRPTPNRFERPSTPPPDQRNQGGLGEVSSGQPAEAIPTSPSGRQASDGFEQRARAMLALGDAATAREVLAAALVVYPRSKPLRSLYYVATACAALHDGELMLATTQLETALAHYDQCLEAAKMLEHIRRHGTGEREAIRRLFQ